MTPAEELAELVARYRRSPSWFPTDTQKRLGNLLNLTILAALDQEKRINAIELYLDSLHAE